MSSRYPITNHRFLLEVEGLHEVGMFSDVQGLSVEIGVETIAEGGQNHYEHKVPSSLTWSNVTLTRGLVRNNQLFEWFAACGGQGLDHAENKVTRRTVAITLIDEAQSRLRSWTLQDAFPVKWTGPDFAAGTAAIATESVELAHHGISVESSW